MLVFCRYTVVYSAMPQVIKGNCIDCIMYIQMYFDVFMFLRDFSRFFFTLFFKYSDPVSVCVVAICNYLNPDNDPLHK